MPSLSGKTVLLAFDGSVHAASAAQLADAIAKRLHAMISVQSVVDITPVPIPAPLDSALLMLRADTGGAIHAEREREMRGELEVLLGHSVAWHASVDLGIPAEAIAQRASQDAASLVVMGLRRHGRLDRAVHDETTLSVMRKSAVPVLGIVPGAVDLPTSVLVAMDFSRASVRAAATAATLVAPGGRLTLAYVESALESGPGTSEGVIHSLGLDAAFECLERELGTASLLVDHVVLHHTKGGMPSQFLLEYAEDRAFDLLATGSARQGRLDRVLLGSVSADLVRDGRCSVLVVPPRASDRDRDE